MKNQTLIFPNYFCPHFNTQKKPYKMCFLNLNFLVDVFLSCISLFVFLFCWKVARILFGIVGKNPTRTKLSFCKKVINQLIKQNPTPHFLSGDHSQPRVPHIKLKYAYIRLLQSFCRLFVYVVFRVVLLFFFQCSKRDKHTTRFKCAKIRIKIRKKRMI